MINNLLPCRKGSASSIFDTFRKRVLIIEIDNSALSREHRFYMTLSKKNCFNKFFQI
jgi:hypothetical protein